jgi:uncharacterized membrane protein YkoI
MAGSGLLIGGMKLLTPLVFSLFFSLSPLAASPSDPEDAKITRNEAQHIALTQYPGARVIATKLETVQGVLIWSIEIALPDAKKVAVAVDAQTGRIVPGKEGAR